MAACQVVWSTGAPSGTRRRASMYGKLNRNTEMPAAASSSATPDRNGWVMPAPAPWAITDTAIGWGARVLVQRPDVRIPPA